ncbi:MAG: hypothetical protein MAGBODY4_01086 [Candidatus Marinimicrobia bacterium]|nr:hypothetical protein [Candidatus Neomarinimicrobiota bacterium]
MEWQKSDFGFYVKLTQGEKVMASLTEFAKEHELQSGFFSGIGAFREMTVAYRDTETQSYPTREFPETHEVLSCKGNFSLKDGEPFPHCHIVFSDTDYRAHGGHLMEATVAVIGEFAIFTTENEIHRKLDSNIGLAVWNI